MVLIPIRAPLVSLCITIISVISELAFLTAALSFLRFQACRRLQLRRRVLVRSQHRRVLAVTLFAMLAFVCLETVTSIFSDPQRKQKVEVQPCVRNVFGSELDDNAIESEAIHFSCTKIVSKNVSHFQGNFSSITGQTSCDSSPMYSYIIGKRIRLSAEGAVRSCKFRSCAFVRLNDKRDTVHLSGVELPNVKVIDYLPTTIDPKDAELLNLQFVAASLASDYANSISEEGEIRRRALLGSFRDNCSFIRDDGPATTIPLGALIGAGLVWISSLLFFVASLFFRKKIFFDITHPMHWARKARHDLTRATGQEPELELVKVNGQVRITVTGYSSDTEVD